jgi:phytol kinase
VDRLVEFFVDSFPGPELIAWGAVPSFVWAYVCLAVAGHLKVKRGVRTGYTRKMFHFAIFSTAAAAHALWGVQAVCLFGGMTSLVVLYAVVRGCGNALYEAMAREKDEPRRTVFIVTPYIATVMGGVAANVLFGELAVLGYLTAGIGDAVGEPVGTRFGRYEYRVPSFAKVHARRSYEGSVAVFFGCVVALAIGATVVPSFALDSNSLILIPVVGLVCAVTEAVSPHGWDNLTLQIVPCVAVKLLT